MPKNIDMRGRIMAAVLFTTFSAISSVSAEDKANVEAIERGRFNAEVICSTCHTIPDQRYPRLITVTPTFDEIANRPNLSARALHEFFGTTHWDTKTNPLAMPDLMLSEKQKGDIIAYIFSLRREP